jgi:hypothetical protein
VRNEITGIRRDLFLNSIFILFVLTVLFIRGFIFFNYNIKILDTDQFFMWLGASDYAKGLFYEPRYYGQDYNTFMEGLFSVPLLRLKVPVYYAVPIATHFIFLFPFFFTAFYLFCKQKKIQAILVLAIILCMPVHYDLLNSLPRGFVTGLFFTSFFITSILNPFNLRLLALNTTLSVLGYFVNPNSLLVSAPFLFYIFLHQYKNRKYYFVTFSCLLLVVPFYLFFNQFYITHNDYIKNDLQYRLSTDFFWINISNLDQKFAHISFLFARNSLLLLFTLLIFGFVLYRGNRKAFHAFLALLATILGSFCMGKTLEGAPWVYISFSRMYLGIPLAICLFVACVEIKESILLVPFCLLTFLFSGYKLYNADSSLAYEYQHKNWFGVYLMKFDESLHIIDFYKTVCRENGADFILASTGNYLKPMVIYGGPATDEHYPETQETVWEKRYWVREKNKNRVIERFIVLAHDANLDIRMNRKGKYEIRRLDNFGLMLVTNNKLPMGEFIEHMKTFEYRD